MVDIYDFIEKGQGHELPYNYLQCSTECQQQYIKCKFIKRGNKNNKSYIMQMEDDSSIYLFAQYNEKDLCWQIYSYKNVEPQFKLSKPLFILQMLENQDDFVLWNVKCEKCYLQEGKFDHCSIHSNKKQQILYIKHVICKRDEGSVHSIHLLVPDYQQDGSRICICPSTNKDQDNLQMHQYCFRQITNHMLINKKYPQDCIKCESKLPQWNSIIQGWCIDSMGRMKLASKRNIQLQVANDSTNKMIFQMGKEMKNGNYIIDYQYPFSFVQAFAVGLSTFNWKTKV